MRRKNIRLSEDAIKEQRDFAENLLQNTAVPTFVLDPQHRVLIWNKACEELTGVKAEEVTGTDTHWKAFYTQQRPCLSDTVIAGQLDDISELFSNYSTSSLIPGGVHAEGWFHNHTGKREYYLIEAAPTYDRNGKLIAAIETLKVTTESKVAVEALYSSEESLRLVIDNAPLGIIQCNTEGVISITNQALLTIMGSPSEEATKSINVFTFPPLIEAGISGSIRKCMESGKTVCVEHPYTSKWGKTLWMHCYLTPARDMKGQISGVLAMLEDFSDYKRTEEALRDSEQVLRVTFEQAAVGIVHADLEGRWISVNQKFCEIVGYSPQELREMTLHQITHPDDLKLDLDSLKRLVQGEVNTFSIEKRYIHKSGQPIWVNLSVSLVRDSFGNPKFFIGIIKDISNRKKIEDTVREQNIRFRKELQLASIVQSSLFPTNLPQVPGIALAAAAVPASEVGGDYSDLFITRNNKLGIAIGDVMGKGVPAALVMTLAYADVRNYALEIDSPSEVMYWVNRVMFPNLDATQEFITLFYGTYDPDTRELVYSNAGHNPPVVYRSRSSECEILKTKNFYLGGREHVDFREGKVGLEGGDIVLFYTDGLKEGKNRYREQFGMDRIKQLLINNSQLDPDGIQEIIFREFVDFLDGEPSGDDVTMVLLKVV